MIQLSPRAFRKHGRHPADCPGWVIGRKARDGYRVDIVWRDWVIGPDVGQKVVVDVDAGTWSIKPDEKGYRVHQYAGGTGRYLRITLPTPVAHQLGVEDSGYEFLGVQHHEGGGISLMGVQDDH